MLSAVVSTRRSLHPFQSLLPLAVKHVLGESILGRASGDSGEDENACKINEKKKEKKKEAMNNDMFDRANSLQQGLEAWKG